MIPSQLLDELGVQPQLFIDGGWRDSADGATLAVTDPADGTLIAEIAAGGPDDALAATEAASKAQATWSTAPPRERAEVLRRAFALMSERRDLFIELIVREGGKSRTDAAGEVTYAAEFFRWYSEEATRAIGQISIAPNGDKRIIEILQPIGVALLVTPWNFPAAMVTRKVAPALAAGCSVVVKPASDTPLTALALAALLAEAGVPNGVVNVVPAHRSGPVVNAVIAHPATRMLSFTGSTEVGSLLLEQAARRVLRCSMELGGNAPFIVCADADVERAADAAYVAKMRNAGESCIAANRFFVHESIREDFASALARKMSSASLGHGLDPSVDVGPLINIAARDALRTDVDAAVDRGARLVTAAKVGSPLPGAGAFFEPTVLTDLNPADPILATELFGPVATIVGFSDDAEAITLANDTPFGLAGYVFAGDIARAMRIAEALEVGMVGINRGLISDPAAAFGGVKASGLGREGGHEGLLEFLERKYIAVDWNG